MPEYTIVAKAQSGVRFGKDDGLVVRQFPSDAGPVDILIKTRITAMTGFAKPVPMGLMAEIQGSAPTLDDALTMFSRAAQSLCPLLAFMGNSPIEDMTPEIGFESAANLREREFFQQFLPETPFLFMERRRLSASLVGRVLTALAAHAESERLRRTLAQYYQALRNWAPGQEVLALAHLWMGVEALTPVILRRTMAIHAVDRAGLAALWQVEEKQLDAEVRKRLIMAGDEQAYAKAKKASDGFEHGFLGFAEIHANSDAVRAQVAAHLRKCVLDELGVTPEDLAVLSAQPYDKPGHLHFAKYLRATLISPGPELAAPGQAYPMLEWKTKFVEGPDAAPGEVRVKLQESITPRLADGVQLRLGSMEVWGGQAPAIKRDDES